MAETDGGVTSEEIREYWDEQKRIGYKHWRTTAAPGRARARSRDTSSGCPKANLGPITKGENEWHLPKPRFHRGLLWSSVGCFGNVLALFSYDVQRRVGKLTAAVAESVLSQPQRRGVRGLVCFQKR